MNSRFPSTLAEMQQARRDAFSGIAGGHRGGWPSSRIAVSERDFDGDRRTILVQQILRSIQTWPEGAGAGYCVVSGLSSFMDLDGVRREARELLTMVWKAFQAASPRIGSDRSFTLHESITDDGRIDPARFGSSWSFKTPHADRRGVLFSHVFGPISGFDGGDILIVDALSYASNCGLTFDDAMEWFSDANGEKPVLKTPVDSTDLAAYVDELGQLDEDSILFVNNSPEGVLHGATALALNGSPFSRILHRVVVYEEGGWRSN